MRSRIAIAWVLIVIITALIGFEMFLRIFPPELQGISWNHWENQERAEEYNIRYAFNKEIGYEKVEVFQEYRAVSVNRTKPIILILGDSVSELGSYPNLLSEKLDVTVINAGVIGYDTELEYKYLKFRGLEFKPDLVILQFNPNDFAGTPIILQRPDGFWEAFERKSGQVHVNPWMFENSMIYRTLKLLKWAHMKKDTPFLLSTVEKPLSDMKELLNGTPFLFVVFSYFGNDSSMAFYNNLTQSVIKDTHMENFTLDLTQNLSVNDSTDSWHLNENGQRILAEALAERITYSRP